MRVLVACEWSGVVRDAFLEAGHDAWSIDVEKGYGKFQCNHIQEDVRRHLGSEWDLMIAFPPCTYLTKVGAQHWNDSPYQERALAFIQQLLDAPIGKIALENPVGAISTRIKLPDQIIQPWYFGHPYTKKTCLWLKGLPKLVPQDACHPGDIIGEWTNYTRSPKFRGKTFEGIAKAMVSQWG